MGGNCARPGFIFQRGEPVKISQEIQPHGTANWQNAHPLWVTVDTKERRHLHRRPFGSASRQQNSHARLSPIWTLPETSPGAAITSITPGAEKPPTTQTAQEWCHGPCRKLLRMTGGATTADVRRVGAGLQGVGGGPVYNGRIYQLSDTSFRTTAQPSSYYPTHISGRRAVEPNRSISARTANFAAI